MVRRPGFVPNAALHICTCRLRMPLPAELDVGYGCLEARDTGLSIGH
jgi:hypothetical protein